jgi:hypothetical protein
MIPFYVVLVFGLLVVAAGMVASTLPSKKWIPIAIGVALTVGMIIWFLCLWLPILIYAVVLGVAGYFGMDTDKTWLKVVLSLVVLAVLVVGMLFLSEPNPFGIVCEAKPVVEEVIDPTPAPEMEETEVETEVVTEIPTEAITPEPTPEATATPTETPADRTIINGCPTKSLGVHPYSKEALIFLDNPYPGVRCEYELYYDTGTTRIVLGPKESALIADWAASCPSGPKCEGTWVALKTFDVPATWLVHVYVYTDGYVAAARFPSFACEYLAYGNKGHTNENIRVPDWAKDFGSILSVSPCPGFAGVPGGN